LKGIQRAVIATLVERQFLGLPLNGDREPLPLEQHSGEPLAPRGWAPAGDEHDRCLQGKSD